MIVAESDRLAVEEVVREHGRTFVRGDHAGQTRLWDAEHENLTLFPTERVVPIDNFAEICDYYSKVIPLPDDPVSIDLHLWDITDLTIDFLTEDVAFALALVDMGYEIYSEEDIPQLFPGYGPRGGIGRCRIWYIVKRTAKGWKIIHSEDSSLDLFRANQLSDFHDDLVDQAIALLDPILNPPIENALNPGTSEYSL